MNIITQKLTYNFGSYNYGTEGSPHALFHFDEWTLTKKKEYGPEWKFILHVGLVLFLEIQKNGKPIHFLHRLEGNVAAAMWHDSTHIKLGKLDSYYRRQLQPDKAVQ